MAETTKRPDLPLEERLRRHVVRRLRQMGAGDATDDIAGEVMVKYARYRPTAYKNWLEKTMRTTWADYWRRRLKVDLVSLPPSSFPSDPDAGPPQPFPSALMASSLSTPAADRDLVARMLAVLSPREKAAVVARYWEGLSSQEIADLLGWKSAAVVDTTLGRVERKLRERFGASLDPTS